MVKTEERESFGLGAKQEFENESLRDNESEDSWRRAITT